MVKPKNQPVDYLLATIISGLIIWGVITLATVSFPFSLEKYNSTWYYLWHQFLLGFLPGGILIFLLLKIDLSLLKKLSFYLFFLNLIILSLVFLPKVGIEIKGAHRWLKLGPILFQPSEFLKISFLLYLSAWLANRSEILKRKKTLNYQALFVFLVSLGILGIVLIFQPDLSTLMIIFLASLVVYFVATSTPWWHSLLIILGSGEVAFFLIKIAPYRLARVLPVLNPQIDPLGIGYQLKQALIAIGSGKIWGIGGGFSLGLSQQKFGFLPHPMTDSIFAIIGEELGFFGSSLLVILFLLFAWRGLKIVSQTRDEFLRLLGVGIISFITFQAFLNIGGIIGILPLAGIPLPFFSYGASHLLTELIGVGILLRISKS